MIGWAKSNGAEKSEKKKTAKEPKAPKPPKATVVISMPRRKKEFGMGTFGTEPADTVAPLVTESQPDQQQQQQEIDPSTTQQGSSLPSVTNKDQEVVVVPPTSTESHHFNLAQFRPPQDPALLSSSTFSTARTPGTPATPAGAGSGLMTPYSARSSYFPATPSSGNASIHSTAFGTTATSSITTPTVAGSSTIPAHILLSPASLTGANNNDNNNNINSNAPVTTILSATTISTSATPGPTTVPETRRQRPLRSDIVIPPAIVTSKTGANARPAHQHPSSLQSSHLFHGQHPHSLQTPATPKTPGPLLHFQQHHHHHHASAASSAHSGYPTSASTWATGTTGTVMTATPKTPGSMDEWRMMQMQLQQQDELNFSLTLPSVSTLASHSTNNNSNNSNGHNHHHGHHLQSPSTLASPLTMTPVSAFGSSSALSLTGQRCCNRAVGGGSQQQHQHQINCPAIQHASGCQTPGPESSAYGSFWTKRPNSPGNTLSGASVTSPGSHTNHTNHINHTNHTLYQQPPHANHSFLNLSSVPTRTATPPSSGHPLYLLGDGGGPNSNTTSTSDLPNHAGLQQLATTAPAVGSTTTLHSDYAPSSTDASDYDTSAHLGHAHLNHYSPSYGPSSAGSEGPMLAGGYYNGTSTLYPNDPYPYLRASISASAVGGTSHNPLPSGGPGSGATTGNCQGKNGRHCKNCPKQQQQQQQPHSRRPSLGSVSILASPTAMATTNQSPGALAILGGTDMEPSNSGSSLNNGNSISRSSSPSPGPLRALSSKLAANTIKKLSASQRSLFSSSREDLTCCQESFQNVNGSQENILSTNNESCCCCCSCANGMGRCGLYGGGGGGGSVGSTEGQSVNGGGGGSTSSKAQRLQKTIESNFHGKLGSLRDSSCNKKEKSRKSSTRNGGTNGGAGDTTMDYNYSSQFVRQEFAQYNYERQIQDFQRAARVFKEQKALTTAAAAASIAAEARAAIAEAAAAAAESAARHRQRVQQEQQHQNSSMTPGSGSVGSGLDMYSSSGTSLAITPIQETDEEGNCASEDVASPRSQRMEENSTKAEHQLQQHPLHSTITGTPGRTASGLLKSVTRPHRRVGSSTGSALSGQSIARKRFASQGGTEGSSRGSSVHKGLGGRTDSSYLELGQVGMPMGMDLKIPGLGLGLGFGLDALTFESFNDSSTSLDQGRDNDSRALTITLDVRRVDLVEDNSTYEDIPLQDLQPNSIIGTSKSTMAISPLSPLPKDLTHNSEEVSSRNGRVASISQEHRGSTGLVSGTLNQTTSADAVRGRSVYSICSVDTVSQQISARHRQHSRLANLSNVASLYSNYDPTSTSPAGLTTSCLGTGSNIAGASGATTGNGGAAARGIVMENSPIQVVRATVGTVDDPSLPCFTFRMWVLSTLFVVMGSAISEYNFFRSNSAYFSIYFVQLASYFCGKAMARWLPTREFEIWIPGAAWLEHLFSCRGQKEEEVEGEIHSDDNTGSFGGNGQRRNGGSPTGGPIRGTDRSTLARSNVASTKNGREGGSAIGGTTRPRRRYSWTFTLNPGKFNMKEHMLIGVAAAAGCAPAYATNVLAIQSLVFNSPLGPWTGIGLVISSQCIGFSMAWFLLDYVIKPSVMIWPATLVNVSLYNTLHEHKVLTRWFTRMQLFWYAFLAVFLYQWLPRMFMPILTSLALLCWIKPSSNVLRKLGSGYTGLGIGCISLDWSIISGVGPLFTPWWAQCNFFVGLILMLWLITPLVYFSNYWSAMSYPIVSSNLFDNTAQLYDISKIVNPDLTFNVTMYESYSPIIMTPYFAITYGTSFMAVMATFVHVALYYGPDIWLIAKTRTLRRLARIQKSDLVQGIRARFSKESESEDTAMTASDPAYTVSAQLSFLELAPVSIGSLHEALDAPPRISDSTVYNNGAGVVGGGSARSSRKNSETVSFRNDVNLLDGGSGIGAIAGLSTADDRHSFQQSSHYRQLSQQQELAASMATGLAGSASAATGPCHQLTEREREEIERWAQIPTEMFGTEDIHTRLMKVYPEIPGRWFGALFVVCFVISVVVCNTSDIHLPVHALILALLLSAIFAIPMAIIQALSSSQIGLNVLSEVVCGYLLPGNQLANSVFKCYSYMTLYQCMNLTQGLKLGHYMKVPPRKILITVIYGTVVGAFVNIQVLDWVLLYNRQALFDADPRSGWSFRNLDLFFSASLLWGAISPTRLFASSSIYHFLPMCFVLGLFIPVPFYLLSRHYPPLGSYCKGRSPDSSPLLFFLPKCTCDSVAHTTEASLETAGVPPRTNHQDADGAFGGETSEAAAYPKPHHTDRRDQLSGLSTFITPHVDPAQGKKRRCCWPLLSGKSKDALKKGAEELNDKSGPTSLSNSTTPTITTSGCLHPHEKEAESPPSPPPHLYQGRSGIASRTYRDPHGLHDPDAEAGRSVEYYLRRVPWHLVNMPLACAGASFVPQAPASFVVSAGVVAFIFAFVVLRYRHEWWRRYTFVLAAALDAGTQICNMAIFVVFALILKGSVEFPNWAGNDGSNPERCGVGDGYN